MKKKIFILFLTAAVGLSAVACGGNTETDTIPDDGTQIEDASNNGTSEDGENPEEAADTDSNADGSTDDGNQNAAPNPSDKPSGSTAKPSSGSNNSNSSNSGSNNSGSNNNGSGSSAAALKGTAEDIIADIYKSANLEIKLGNTSINAENMAYYLGVDNIKIKQGVASEPLMSSIAHSVVLIELEDGQDIAKVKKDIKNNVDGYKWVCVGVDPENILVDNIGNFVLLVMDEDAKTIMNAFKAMSNV